MKQIQYNQNDNPTLYIVATPIGNLNEINQRAIDTLSKSKLILCEDTRNSKKLLSSLNIKYEAIESYHMHNEFEQVDSVINRIKELKDVSLISDAGYPIICDPGYILVNKAIENDINVVVINGTSALIPAIITSGFNPLPFTFIGFLPSKKTQALKMLEQFKSYHHTLVIYESRHRLNQTINVINEVLGNVDIVISREITKMHETHMYAKIDELLNYDLDLKGEMVIVIDNSKQNESIVLSEEEILELVNEKIKQKVSKKDAIKQVSKQLGLDKNYVYGIVHK